MATISWEIQMCAVPSHPMGRFLWDYHGNPIPMDNPVDHLKSKAIGVLYRTNYKSAHEAGKQHYFYFFILSLYLSS